MPGNLGAHRSAERPPVRLNFLLYACRPKSTLVNPTPENASFIFAQLAGRRHDQLSRVRYGLKQQACAGIARLDGGAARAALEKLLAGKQLEAGHGSGFIVALQTTPLQQRQRLGGQFLCDCGNAVNVVSAAQSRADVRSLIASSLALRDTRPFTRRPSVFPAGSRSRR